MTVPTDAALDVRSGDRQITVTTSGERPELVFAVAGSTLASAVLGVVADGLDLGRGARVAGHSLRTVREEWTAYTGKATGGRVLEHEELAVRFQTAETEWALIARVTPDGFAFRYELPQSSRSLGAEHTRLTVPADARAWVLDYQTWYETPRFGANLADLPAGDYGFPLLIEADPGRFLLVSESGIDGRSSGAHIVFDGEGFTITPADAELDVAGGHRTPWRVLFAGSLDRIVASTLVDELAPPAEVVVAPRPGRAAWSWWSSQYSGAYLDVQLRFTDFAAEQGWEHVLVDCGWDAAWVPELVAYASARGIQVHLWSAWSDLDGAEALKKLALWRSWGVAGIKVDFMESESRDRYCWYDAIIAESARVGLMVNFHGSVIPRGWARTHPHVVSYEGIRGAEYYVFYGDPLTAAHNVIQPFTRNVVGSMDYTPVAFGAPRRETTDAHELALSIVYESGITHFADDPDRYRERPAAAALLAELAPAWDEVRLLEGHPDTHAVLARRRGDRWFVGCIGAAAEAMAVSFDPTVLVGGTADVWIVEDRDGALAERLSTVDGPVTVPIEPRGGFAAVVVPTGAELRRATERHPVAGPTASAELLVYRGAPLILDTDATRIRVSGGWQVERASAGRWTLAPTTPPQPGELVVVTLEKPGHDDVPAVSHIRVAVPLVAGPFDVAALPFRSARNAVGPVERNMANGGGDPRDGEPFSVRGRRFQDGLGVSQDSEVVIAIPGDMRSFTGFAAIDDETPDADAVAEILVDDRLVESLRLDAAANPIPFAVDVSDAETLTLRTTAGQTPESHVDWLTLRLTTTAPGIDAR